MYNSNTSDKVTKTQYQPDIVGVNSDVDTKDNENDDPESLVRNENLNEVFFTSSASSGPDFPPGRHSNLSSPWQVTAQSDFENYATEDYSRTHELFVGLGNILITLVL